MENVTKAQALLAALTLLQFIEETAAQAAPSEQLDLQLIAGAIVTLLEWKI